jgi:hypothetical protein
MKVRAAVLSPALALAGAALLVPALYWRSVPAWSLEGFAMTFCPCGTPCPCRSGKPPNHHTCEAATFVDVVHGHYGGVGLDGLRFVTVADMHRGAWVVVYAEAGTPDGVRRSMLRILENMLMPRTYFAPLVAPLWRPRVTVRGVARIEYEVLEGGLRRRVRLPSILELDGRLRTDETGRPRQVVPALDVLTNVIAYADNLVYRYADRAAGLELDYSGRQANMKTFRVTKQDYDAGRLLAQDARTMRGGWTLHQRALITDMVASGALRLDRLAY